MGTYQGNVLTHNLTGNTCLQLFQLCELLWTNIWPEGWSWCVEAYLHLQKTKTKLFALHTYSPRYSAGTYQGNVLTHNLSHNTHPQLFQLCELLCTNIWPEGWSCCVEAHLHLEKQQQQKKCRWGIIHCSFPLKSLHARKKSPPVLSS